jgi:tRNA(fMet)-specific endonuclease VapC
MSFLVDTNICSALMKGNGAVMTRFLQHMGRLNISVITAAELWVWVFQKDAPGRRIQGMMALLSEAPILPLDRQIAEEYGRIQAQLIAGGKKAPEMDLLIACTALIHDLTLVTDNESDFVNVPKLRVVNWLT